MAQIACFANFIMKQITIKSYHSPWKLLNIFPDPNYQVFL